MLEAGFWGLLAGSSLILGAALGIWLPIPRRIVALIMGFGAGALVSALAFDLTAEAFEEGGAALTAIGLATGGLTFFIGDVLIESGAGKAGAAGLAIVLGALLDGLPESFVLGASLLSGAGVSVSFLVAVLLSNLPEGLAGARDLRAGGHSPTWIIGLWSGVAIVSGVAAAIGYALIGSMAGEPQGRRQGLRGRSDPDHAGRHDVPRGVRDRRQGRRPGHAPRIRPRLLPVGDPRVTSTWRRRRDQGASPRVEPATMELWTTER